MAGQKRHVGPSIPELAIEARRAAVDEVEKLLQHPEDLKRLQELYEDYAQKHHANKLQLSATVGSQVEAVKSGLDLLDKAQRTLNNMRECYKTIDQLCTETSNLIENHEKIQLLSAVHYNLGKTLQDVEHIMALPNEAAEAEEMLKDDSQLLQAFECLAILEGTSNMAQQALGSGSKLKAADANNLSAYFNKVKETMGKFEERLWSLIRSFIALGRDNPGMLVSAVRVVELQELVDKQLEASGRGTTRRKAYKRRCEQQIGMAIQNTFAPLLQSCSQLAAAGENTDARTSEILEDAHAFVAQLADIYDHVAPCFPEHYRIFNVIWTEYHNHIAFMLDCIGACADLLANSDIIKVMGWVHEYYETLRNFSIEEEELQLPGGPGRGVPLLVAKYIERTNQMLRTWFANILNADFSGEPKPNSEGRLYTPGPTDFFRILNEQTAVVEEVSSGDFLLRTAQAACGAMRDFQALQAGHLAKELSSTLLCAAINNNTYCYNQSMEYAERMDDTLAEGCKGMLDIEEQCRGFLELCKSATLGLVASVFNDAPFLELFHKLYGGAEEWKTGGVTASILATLGDYLDEFRELIDPSYFKRLCELALEEVVAHYCAAFLTYSRAITEDSLRATQADIDAITAFFQQHSRPEKVAKAVRPLVEVKEVAASDSVEAFVLGYTSLLQVSPGITPALVEKVVAARSDLTRADVKEVMEQCREAFAQRQRQLGEADAAAGGGSSGGGGRGASKAPAASREKDSAFRVALHAAKRRPAAQQ